MTTKTYWILSLLSRISIKINFASICYTADKDNTCKIALLINFFNDSLANRYIYW